MFDFVRGSCKRLLVGTRSQGARQGLRMRFLGWIKGTGVRFIGKGKDERDGKVGKKFTTKKEGIAY